MLKRRLFTTLGSPAPMAAAGAENVAKPLMAKKMFEDIRNLTGSYLDRVMRERGTNGLSLTEVDLVGCANHLSRDWKHEGALEVLNHERKSIFFFW